MGSEGVMVHGRFLLREQKNCKGHDVLSERSERWVDVLDLGIVLIATNAPRRPAHDAAEAHLLSAERLFCATGLLRNLYLCMVYTSGVCFAPEPTRDRYNEEQ